MFRLWVALAVGVGLDCVAPISLAAGDKVERDGFISEVGTYRLYHGELTLRIYEDKGKLNYKIGRTLSARTSLTRRFQERVFGGPADPIIEKGANWFALAESPRARVPHTIWIFDGRDLLVQIAYDPKRERDDCWGAVEYHSDSTPSVVTNAPKVVRDRLPESFKKKFEAKSR
jgi:hypothetical protein